MCLNQDVFRARQFFDSEAFIVFSHGEIHTNISFRYFLI